MKMFKRKEANEMRLIGLGLCLIGIGIIGYDIVAATHTLDVPRWLLKGRKAGTYKDEDDWSFPEE